MEMQIKAKETKNSDKFFDYFFCNLQQEQYIISIYQHFVLHQVTKIHRKVETFNLRRLNVTMTSAFYIINL